MSTRYSSTPNSENKKLILEVGCGGGKYTFTPAASGENVVYLDIDKPKMKLQNFIRSDACHLPFRDRTFTEIYARHVIEHLNEPSRFLQDSNRLLETSGKIHVWCPNFLSSNATKDPTHRHVFNFLKLRKILSQSGFRPIFAEPNPGLSDRFPKVLVYLAKILLLLLSNELYVIGIKKN